MASGEQNHKLNFPNDHTEVFPEKDGETGSIYIEAADKVTLKKERDITFINVRDVLGIIYQSKSGSTKLKWRQIRGRGGKVTGEASTNSLVNLITAKVIDQEYVNKLANMETSSEDVDIESNSEVEDKIEN